MRLNTESPSKSWAFRFVISIGLVSLFADMTYQGAHGNVGPYLAFLGASGAVVGTVAGGGEMVNYVLRLVFGYWADRSRRYWRNAFFGYTINLVAVPLLAFTHHWAAAAALLILERAGKGIRTPSRDVMLSHAADQVGRGWAFGVHEAMDQTGGILGPLLMAGVLFLHRGYRTGFAVLAIPAVLALMTLIFTWRSYPHPELLAGDVQKFSTQKLSRPFWIFVAGVGLLAMGYADFAFMAFHFKKLDILGAVWIPVAYAGTMGLQGLASLYSGKLFDRVGINTLLWASLPAAGFAPLVFFGGPIGAWTGLCLWALGMGTQSSVMKAFVAEIVESGSRGSAYGLLNSVYGVFWFIGSAAMGLFYDHSLLAVVIFSLVLQGLAILVLWRAKNT